MSTRGTTGDPHSVLNRSSRTTSELLVDALSHLRDADPAPAYIQIERCIRLLVADGSLESGRRLPTVRALADQLGLAANTVARAYAELVSQGIVISRAGGGTVVAGRQPTAANALDHAGSEQLRRVARHLVAYSLALGHTPGEVIHAVRAELAALGSPEVAQTEPHVEVWPTLPTHSVPPGRVASANDGMEVSGLVARATILRRNDLAPLGRGTLQQPFACDEGWVVPSLRWEGVWLADVLVLAEPHPLARFVRVCAGTYNTPLSLAAAGNALLADRLDDQPLALEHGAPWRLVLPGGACYTSVKWVDRLELVADPGVHASPG